jgi:transposase
MPGHISGDKIVVIETRRRWSDDERGQAVAETQQMSVSAVARKRGIAKSLLFRWRKEAGLSAKRRVVAPFVPVQIAVPTSLGNLSSVSPQALATSDASSIEIELVDGTRLRLHGAVREDSLRHVITVLRG